MGSNSSGFPVGEENPKAQHPVDLPLRILEALRDHDRPLEVLEDEDVSVSLPRRLGLTNVVEGRIAHYQKLQKSSSHVPAAEVKDLLLLVLRRPDYEGILSQAGGALAKEHLKWRLWTAAIFTRFLPRALSERVAVNAVHRLMRRFGAAVPLATTRAPLSFEFQRLITAESSTRGTCVLYTTAIENIVQQVKKIPTRVEHTACQAAGDPTCIWIVAGD